MSHPSPSELAQRLHHNLAEAELIFEEIREELRRRAEQSIHGEFHVIFHTHDGTITHTESGPWKRQKAGRHPIPENHLDTAVRPRVV
jgi:hypothetical protein